MSKLKGENSKKRKYQEDVNIPTTHSPKKQQQSILQYCFTKSTTAIKAVLIGNEEAQQHGSNCPVCNMTLEELSIIQVQSHVNSCLDNSATADTDNKSTADTTTKKVKSSTSQIDNTEDTIIGANGKESPTTAPDMIEYEFDADKVIPSNVTIKDNLTSTASITTPIVSPIEETTINNNGSTATIINSSKSSWAKLFSGTAFKIRGIWSSRKGDHAPGLTESEISWFGDPKSANTADATTTVKKKRVLPYYKRLAGTHMVVDAFSFGEIPDCEGYLLSHFHSDHYGGLNSSWIHGPIYCSEITARLVESRLRVAKDFIHPLPMDKPCLLSGTDGLTVTLIDANHCPGAVMFLITIPQQQGKILRYLHTGDFRACPKMCVHPKLKQPENPALDIVYLDTTYLDPKYSFPAQNSCIQAACDLAKQYSDYLTTGVIMGGDLSKQQHLKIDHWFKQEKISGSSNNNYDSYNSSKKQERLLVVVGTYSLGKERIFIEIAQCLSSKIYVADEKRSMLETLQDEELNQLLTNEPQVAQVHVIPLWHILPENLEAYYHSIEAHFTQMIAFKPTGWTFRGSSFDHSSQQQLRSLESIIKARPPDLTAAALKPTYESPHVTIYGVPYSEHSSYRELALFIVSLDIRRIVPTVNIHHERSRIKMTSLFETWEKDKKKMVAAATEDERSNGVIIDEYSSLNHW